MRRRLCVSTSCAAGVAFTEHAAWTDLQLCRQALGAACALLWAHNARLLLVPAQVGNRAHGWSSRMMARDDVVALLVLSAGTELDSDL